MVQGNDILGVLIFAALYWVSTKIYRAGYDKGREDTIREFKKDL